MPLNLKSEGRWSATRRNIVVVALRAAVREPRDRSAHRLAALHAPFLSSAPCRKRQPLVVAVGGSTSASRGVVCVTKRALYADLKAQEGGAFAAYSAMAQLLILQMINAIPTELHDL
jgi:hypothetical protein